MAMAHGTEAHESQAPDRNGVAEPVIVVGLDGSPSSWDAFAWAAGEALRLGGSVVAVYALPITDAAASFGVPYDYSSVEQARQEVADAVRSEAGQRAKELGVTLGFITQRGDATRILTATARELHAKLIVVGRSAKRLHHVAGSLSHRLTSRSDAPVVVVVP
jgi:nucleotide-binding universal stress UspA family protein